MEDRAYAGYLPFVDDEDDDANQGVGGLPRALVATEGLRRLFQETFGAGRELPHRRPPIAFWTLELARAADLSLDCPVCGMSHFVDEHAQCPYCGATHSAFIRVKTPRWEILIPGSATAFLLPKRLFYPFSFEHHDDTVYEAVLNFAAKPQSLCEARSLSRTTSALSSWRAANEVSGHSHQHPECPHQAV